jgi:hypothetical protein
VSASEELEERLDARLQKHGGRRLDDQEEVNEYYNYRGEKITHQEVYLTICEALLSMAWILRDDQSTIDELEDAVNKLHWGKLV